MVIKLFSKKIGPIALMRLTEIKDPDELLKKFDRSDIIIEGKYDGWRLQVIKTDGKIHLYSRKGEEKTDNFPELVKSLSFLPNETLVEGELVFWDKKNKQDEGKVTSLAGSSAENAHKKMKEFLGSLKIHLYDVLWANGKIVASKGFEERRKILEGIIKENDKVKLSKTDGFENWQKVMNKSIKSGGEGIVLKIKNKPYEYKAKGESEAKPADTMLKYKGSGKGGAGKSDSDDYVVFDYKVSEKGKLKALFGQYYKGKLYHISEISNFSKENEEKIKNKLKKGCFVIEIGFQERQPGGLRHQKFLRYRDDKRPKDATMNEFHSKNIDKFKEAKKNDADDFILSTRVASLHKTAAYVDIIIRKLEKMLGIEHSLGGPGNIGGVDAESMFQVMSQLESGGRTYVIGDSGTSFGPTQVHGPYFFGNLARMSNVESITGISPMQFGAMGKEWRNALRMVRKEKIWNYQQVDEDAVRSFVKRSPKSRIRRREGTFIRYKPDMIVVERSGKHIGKTFDLDTLERIGLDINSAPVQRGIRKIFKTYITDNVARSKLAQLFVMQNNLDAFYKFKKQFNSNNIKRNKKISNLIENVSRQDFSNKIRATVAYVKKSGYDTTAPNAYNIYQLIVIANASGPGRVQQFLYNRKPFSAGNLHYLYSSRFKKTINKIINKNPELAGVAKKLLEEVPANGGMGGFSSNKVGSFYLSKKASEEDFEETIEFPFNVAQHRAIGQIYKQLKEELERDNSLKEEVWRKYEEDTNRQLDEQGFDRLLVEEVVDWVIGNWDKIKEKWDTEGWVGEERRAEFVLSKRATTIMEKLERLPILPVEMWSNFQLTQSLHQPELFEKGKEDPKYLQVKERVAKLSGHTPEDIGEWLERGYWVVYLNKDGFVFSSKPEAELFRERAINEIAGTGVSNYFGNSFRVRMTKAIIDESKYGPQGNVRRTGLTEAKNAADEFLNHPFHEERRKRFAKDVVVIDKLKDLPARIDPVPRGEMPKPGKTLGGWDMETEEGENVSKKGEDIFHNGIRRAAKPFGETLKRRMKGKEEGIEKLVDDVRTAALSKRSAQPEQKALYFPSQYADAIKEGKRRMTIRASDVPVNAGEVVKCVTYDGTSVCDLLIIDKEKMSNNRIEKAFGKKMAQSLEEKFGPGGQFTVIRFDVYNAPQLADDEDKEKMSEVLIDKDGVKLTRGQIKNHYMKPEVRKKIMSRIKDDPVLVYVGTGKNESILKRNHNDKEIRITNDNPNKFDDPNNYFYWVKRRLLSFHQVFGTKTKLGFVDLDIHGSFPLDRAKKYARELAGKLKSKYNVTPTIFESGGIGLHVEFKLGQEVGIDKLRGELKELLDEFNEDWSDVKTGVVKDNGMRSDISTLHNKGSIRVPRSFGETYGKVKKPLGGSQDDEDQFPQSYGKKYTMLPENLDKDPGSLDTGAIPYFPTKGVNFTSGVGSYFDANDKMALSKRETIKEAKTKKVVMLVSPEEFCETEYTIPHDLFVEKFKFEVETVSSGLRAKGNRGTVIEINNNAVDIDVGDYDGLFVVGGIGMIKYSKDKGAQKLLKSFVRQKKPIAMICYAPLLAAEAGIMRGREVTGWPEIMGKVRRSKGIWTGLPIEKDDSLFTAIGPDDSENFAWVFANFLNGEKTLGPAKQKYMAWLEATKILNRIEKFAAAIDNEELKKLMREQEKELKEERPVEPDLPRKPVREEVEMFGKKIKPYSGTYEEFIEKEEMPRPKREAPEDIEEFLTWKREKEEQGLLKGMKTPYMEFKKEKGEPLEEVPTKKHEKEEIELIEEKGDEFDFGSKDESSKYIEGPAEEIKRELKKIKEEEELEEEGAEEEGAEEEVFEENGQLTKKEIEYLKQEEEIATKAKPKTEELMEKQKQVLKTIIDEHLSTRANEEIDKIFSMEPKVFNEHLNTAFVDFDKIEEADKIAEEAYNRMMSGMEKYLASPGKWGAELPVLKNDIELFEKRWEEISKKLTEGKKETEEEEKEDIVEEYSEEALDEEVKELMEKKPYFASKLEIPKDEKGFTMTSWPERPEPPEMSQEAADFFIPKKMALGSGLRKLFNDPQSWDILEKEPHLLKEWVFPYVVRAMAKRWFDINKAKAEVGRRKITKEDFGFLAGGAPFGMFTDLDEHRIEEIRKGKKLEDVPEAKSYIMKAMELVTNLTNSYFSENRAVENPTNIDKWIYDILNKQMIKEIAKEKGFRVEKNMVCSICKNLYSKNIAVPKMERVLHGRWSCPDCAQRVEDLKNKNLETVNDRMKKIDGDRTNAQKLLNYWSKALETLTDPNEIEKLQSQIKSINSKMIEFNEKMDGLSEEKKDIKRKIMIYSAQTSVPWSHTWCPNPTCPGGRMPLSSVDWDHHMWHTKEGKKMQELLKSRYGITSPLGEELAKEQEADETFPRPKGTGKVPPVWLDNVPFVCPHDGVKFTIGQARKQKTNPYAGFLWGPFTRDVWTREKAVREEDTNYREKENPDVELMVAFREMAPIGQDCAVRQYYDFYDKLTFLEEQVKSGKAKLTPKQREKSLRKLFLLATAKDFSFDDPLTFVGWMSRAMIEAEARKNKDRKSVEKQNTKKDEEPWTRIKQDQISIPMLHRWMDKMLAVENPYETFGINSWLVNPQRDGISSDGPGTYFVAKIRSEMKIPGKRGKRERVPYGFKFGLESKGRRTSGKGAPRLLKVLNIWCLDKDDLATLSPEQTEGLNPVLKWQAEKMLTDKDENFEDMTGHDYQIVSLDKEKTQIGPDDYVLVRALVMPGVYSGGPLAYINELENNKIGAKFWDKFRELVVLKEDEPEYWARFSRQIKKTMKEYPYRIEDILDMELFKVKGRKKAQLKIAKNPLSLYKKKRDKTPEPEGKVEKGRNKHRFVIQNHFADKAGQHFDLRLENDNGTLSSWAIPKHKLPKGKERLLAMKVEDHPLNYRSFSGEIPKGEYGAGKIKIHDSGTYDEISWSSSKIVFKLKGKKEKGAYKVFKTDGSKWMIMETNEDDLEKLSKEAAIQKERYKILYHVGPRPPAPKPKTRYLPDPEFWEKADPEYFELARHHWMRPKQTEEPIATGLFMADNWLKVGPRHGIFGNVYTYRIPIKMIKEAGGLHKFEGVNEILFSDEIWNKYKKDIKLLGKIDEKTANEIIDRRRTLEHFDPFFAPSKPGTSGQMAEKRWKNLLNAPNQDEVIKFLNKNEIINMIELIDKEIENLKSKYRETRPSEWSERYWIKVKLKNDVPKHLDLKRKLQEQLNKQGV